MPTSPSERFPPVPDWRPSVVSPLDRIAERIRYYTHGSRDFAVFHHGTCVLLKDGLSDQQAEQVAREVLHEIFHFHADMTPVDMDDGNILVRYNHPAFNVVLGDIVREHWPEIERRYRDALTTHEVLITPLGPNRFDDFGKKALFGRCYMFMDAQDPRVERIERKAA